MNESTGKLQRNEIGRLEFSGIELTSGNVVEICIDGNWICGVIEYWHDNYYWFSRKDGVPVVLRSGIHARLFNSNQRRTTKT